MTLITRVSIRHAFTDFLQSYSTVVDQTRHKKGRKAKPRHWFYIIICGRFESK